MLAAILDHCGDRVGAGVGRHRAPLTTIEFTPIEMMSLTGPSGLGGLGQVHNIRG